MKKMVILSVVVFTLFMAACSKDVTKGVSTEPNDVSSVDSYAYDCNHEGEGLTDRAIYYGREFVSRLHEDPRELAKYLLAIGKLDEFVGVNVEYPIEEAMAIFVKDEDVHKKALEKVEETLAGIMELTFKKDGEEYQIYYRLPIYG